MKQCPACRTPYYDETLNFCTKDGTPLRDGPPSGFDTQPSTLRLPGKPSKSNDKSRVLLSLEIEENLSALIKYRNQAKERGSGFKNSPIAHALVVDGFRYNNLPTLKRDTWLSLLPSLPSSSLSPEELTQAYTFYNRLDNLESIKGSIKLAERKMDKEREMEKVIATLIKQGNPLAIK